MMFDGMGWGFGMLLGPIFMVLVLVFLIAGIVWLALALTRRGGAAASPPGASALRILDERLARGEIDLDEYQARKSAIGGAP